MKSTFLKHSKKILVGAVLAIGCLGMASVAFAEAKATKLKSIEVARALGFTIKEENVLGEGGAVIAIEYEIDFTGKTAEEIKLITDYLQYLEYLNKWNGELPSVVTGESASIFIPVDPTK